MLIKYILKENIEVIQFVCKDINVNYKLNLLMMKIMRIEINLNVKDVTRMEIFRIKLIVVQRMNVSMMYILNALSQEIIYVRTQHRFSCLC